MEPIDLVNDRLQAVEAHLTSLQSALWMQRRKIHGQLNGESQSAETKEIEALVRQLRQLEKDLAKKLPALKNDIETLQRIIGDASSQQAILQGSADLVTRIDSIEGLVQEFDDLLETLKRKRLTKRKADVATRKQAEIAAQRRAEEAKKQVDAKSVLRERETAGKRIQEKDETTRQLRSSTQLLKSTQKRLAHLRGQLSNLRIREEDRLNSLWARHSHTTKYFNNPNKPGGLIKVDISSIAVLRSAAHFFPSLQTAMRSVEMKENEILKVEKEIQSQVKSLNILELKMKEIQKAEEILSAPLPTSLGRGKRPLVVVTEWQHAEELARDFLRWLGFSDARLTGNGADGGVDVDSKRAVAQVKMHSKGVPRFDIQKLVGIASVEQKMPVFFAMSYSRDAVSWAEQYNIALFKFLRTGDVEPVTSEAAKLERPKR